RQGPGPADVRASPFASTQPPTTVQTKRASSPLFTTEAAAFAKIADHHAGHEIRPPSPVPGISSRAPAKRARLPRLRTRTVPVAHFATSCGASGFSRLRRTQTHLHHALDLSTRVVDRAADAYVARDRARHRQRRLPCDPRGQASRGRARTRALRRPRPRDAPAHRA